MKRQHTGLLIIWLVLLSGIRITAAVAQGILTEPVVSISTGSMQIAGGIPLQIQLRYSDGTAVSDEPLLLQRLPDMQETTCTTDANGRCTWHVERGLYQVIFSQPLDSISSLAVAEGGLDGFGLTVGDAPISYHFTFHHDDHVYFDAAPEAAVPDPIIPTADSLHGGIAPTAVSVEAVNSTSIGTTAIPSMTVGIAAVTTLPEEDALPEESLFATDDEKVDTALQADDDQPVNPFWRLLLLIVLGLALGFGLHQWSRKRQRMAAQMAEQTDVEQRISTFILSPQTSADMSTTAHSSTQTGGSEC